LSVQWHHDVLVAENRRSHDLRGASPPGVSAEVLQRCIPWGILIVDQERRLLFANPRGRAFLDAKTGLEERSGRVHVERANIDRAFGKLVQRAAAAHSILADETVGVPNRQGQTRYALKLIRCRTDQGDPAALLVITDLLSSIHVSREAVAKVFNLSDREAEFAELFSCGLRIDAIAARMGIAHNTARVHLRNVFAKTGCASQIELARTFAHLP
jgi:DNA-binding CsgD family transcriptional regulator